MDEQAVWDKGSMIVGQDPNLWRKDACGGTIYRWAHGDTNHTHGWEIDHILPVSHGGTDGLHNLRPLHWRNNRARGGKNTNQFCVVMS